MSSAKKWRVFGGKKNQPRRKTGRISLHRELLEDRLLLAGDVVHRVNAGGSQVAASEFNWESDIWQAPAPYSNVALAKSQTYSNSNPIDLSHASVPAGTPAALFQSERWDNANGDEMSWAFPVAPGQYEVNLYFAEIYTPAFVVGTRQMDVAIEGQLVLDNYDIFAKVGGNKGVVETFQVVSDGTLNIDFSRVKDNPAIKAIEIRQSSVTPTTGTLGTSSTGLNFGAKTVGQTAQQALTFTHQGSSGSQPITISGAAISGGGAAFYSTNFNSANPITLQPGQSTTLNVTYAPTAAGTHSASLAITHNGSNSPLNVALSGQATQPTVNAPPVLAPIGDRALTAGGTLTFDISASDAENDARAFTTSTLPSFISFVDRGNGTGQFVVSPTTSHVGNYDITVTVAETNGSGRSDTETFRLTVNSPTPVGNKNTLFVVANPATLNASDQALIARLQANGYQVTLGDDHHVQAGDAVGRGLVLISESVISGTLAAKFRNAPVPVVSLEPYIFDDLGMTGLSIESNFGLTSGQTQIAIQNPSHPLAGGLSGTVTVYTSGDSLAYGVPNANGIAIASVPGNAARKTIFAYEQGASMPGLVAPARRVGFFAGLNAPAKFTAQAWTLFDQALTWAVGGATTSPPPTANPDSYTLSGGGPFNIPAANGLLANDTGAGALTAHLLTAPTHGALVLQPNGSFSYTPNANYTGADSFTYRASDGTNVSSSATVNLQINAAVVNGAPQLAAISNASVQAGQSLTVNLSASDPNNDPLVLSASGLPAFATLVDNGNGTGTITFTPGAANVGSFPITVTATDNRTPALSNSKSFTVTVTAVPTPSTATYRVNVGGPALSGTPNWTTDATSTPSVYGNASAAFSTGYTTTATIDISHGSIPAGTPAALFQTERWDQPAGEEMAWSFPVEPGSYEVRLYFAEIFSGAFSPGARKFDVSIEGQLVLDDYDVFVAAGGGNKGIVESFLVSADSLLNINFARLSDNPALKGIEIIRRDSLANVLQAAPTALDFGSTLTSGNTQLTLTLTNRGQAGDPSIVLNNTTLSGANVAQFSDSFNDAQPRTLAPGASTTITVTFAPNSTGGKTANLEINHTGSGGKLIVPLTGIGATTPTVDPSILYRVNAGGGQITSTPNWTADSSSSPSTYSNVGAASSNTYSVGDTIDVTHPSVPAGTPAALFQSERWDSSGSNNMEWNFPTAAGQYEVRLYFAEIYSGAQSVGARQFDVSLEGQLVLDNYDAFADVGGYKGVVKSFLVTSDGNLDIDFGRVTGDPAVKAIEILSVAAGNQLLVVPSSAAFGQVLINQVTTRTVQLSNAGVAGDPSITINPANASFSSPVAGLSFSFGQTSPITLAPGQSTNVTLSYAPTAINTFAVSLLVPHSGANSPVTVAVSGSATSDVPISFGKSTLQGTSSVDPTSLQFGPDGRLYVAQQNGLIKVYTVGRNAANNYVVTDTETIDLVQKITNHNDDGAVNNNVNTRLVTGLLVAGTAANPVLYVTSSDPRIGAGFQGTDLNLDTNSGILSRLTWNGSSWVKLDLVRGLPRSEENHASNGMVLDSATNTLYVAQGGNTNMGAPSFNFALLPEYALSAAILSVNLNQIGNSTYDLPTLNDETRAGVNDSNDPFGGNDGRNQAKLVPGGPVQVYSPGYRNPYDVILTQDGRMFTIDNGPNGGWGDVPVGEGPGGNATNAVNEPGVTHGDGLHFVSGPGYYGGHPNPTRSNMQNTFNPGNPQSPVSVNNPIESDYIDPGAQDGSLVVYGASTNGLTEYTASNFGGKMQGDLLSASFNNKVNRAKINGSNNGLLVNETLFNSVGQLPLDITAQGDSDVFPGTIWVGDFATNVIHIFEPGDYDNDPGGEVDPNDFDGDGYSNADEIANDTNPNSAADVPPDWDEDFLSDLSDDDDDNDDLLDNEDALAIDATNGQGTSYPVFYSWENDAPNPGGLLSLGFTGLMTNGVEDYRDLFDPGALTAGGAGGVLTIDSAGPGTALGSTNTQAQAFQFGVNVAGQTEKLTAYTRIGNPFAGLTPQAGQEMGFYVGDGTQDNYIKLVLKGDNGGQIQVVKEFNGVPQVIATQALSLPGASYVDFYLSFDPVQRVVQASYAVTNGANVTAPRAVLGGAIALPSGLLQSVLITGVICHSPAAITTALPVTWDFLGVVPDKPGQLGSSAATLNFGGTTVGNLVTRTIELLNQGHTGDPAIVIDQTTISGTGASQFRDSFNDAGSITLLPGQSTTLTVTYDPTVGGTHAATLQIVHSGQNTPLSIPLSGMAPSAATSTAQALVAIDSGNTLKSSTYNGGSFKITNQSANGQKITSVAFNLATAILPDMVFDPLGTAGDVVAKDFSADSGKATTGQTTHAFSAPRDNGFDALTVNFTDFNPAETFTFSVDVDPSSIRGVSAPGPNDAGSVSGLELAGATIVVTFDDGATFTAQTYRKAGSVGASEVLIAAAPIAQPTLEIVGLPTTPTTVSQANQTARVSGPTGSSVALLIVEGGLYTNGVPNGGYDIDPYETNTAVKVTELFATIGAGGFVDIPITLTQSGASDGYNLITATIVAGGRTSRLAATQTVRFNPALQTATLLSSAASNDALFAELGAEEESSSQVTLSDNAYRFNLDELLKRLDPLASVKSARRVLRL